ncbi:MAG: futalosine hydrolase, partial [Thermodesulfovibrionia bacterium]
MKFLALLASLSFESDRILASMTNVRTTKIAGKTVYRGKYSGLDLLLLNTGIGKVNAAHSATGIIEHFPISCIINLGIGGAYPESGLKKGDIAIALKEIYGDEGIYNAKDCRGIKNIGIPLVQIGKKKY